MTPHQQRTLRFVRDYYAENGRSPTQRTIRDALGLKSTSAVNRQLKALVDYGFLRKVSEYSGRYVPAEIGRVDLARVTTADLLAEVQRREVARSSGQ